MIFAELLAAIEDFDLEAYLLDKGFEPLRSKGGEEWIGDCQKCGKRKCAVDMKKRGFHCWVCQKFETYWDEREHMEKRRPAEGAGGVIALVKWLDGLDTKDAIEFISQHSLYGTGIQELPDLRVVQEVLEGQDALEIQPPECWRPITEVLPYMAKRGMTMDDVRWTGMFWTDGGRYRNRLVFPVFENSKLIYWQARAMYEAEDLPQGSKFIKALNPERTPGAAVSSEVLMNIDTACRFPRVAIVEGPADCVRSGPDTVCTFTKAITPAQVRRLIKRDVKAVDLMWDGPKGPKEPQGAWPEMIATGPWLSMFFDTRLVFLPQGDPGEWPREALWEQRARGVSASHMAKLATL